MFSACVVLAALIIESPGSSLAQEAAPGLELAVRFFEMVCSNEGWAQSTLTMLQRLLKRSQVAFVVFRSNSPQPGILPNENDAEQDELAILGGRQSIVTPRPASHSLGAQSGISSRATPDSNQPNAAAKFDITANAVAPAPTTQNGDDLDLSTFIMSHAGGEDQGMSDWSLFNTPYFGHEFDTDFRHTETYTQNSVVDHNYGLPEQGDHDAAMAAGNGVIWSMFANQLLP
ncbi:hypothetical protein FIBSPDRAFT_1048201 [Athelia psychrophila]|uniref:Uncharacterized protein n=1 Tax=Athelia psychrophila TaxID=1759441 RepID=A0A166E0F0_9AGAM|nr:hypothetical protein FIBSPDRAFT_1048201 [Fibularhizoctonia sp. CBS 109695]